VEKGGSACRPIASKRAFGPRGFTRGHHVQEEGGPGGFPRGPPWRGQAAPRKGRSYEGRAGTGKKARKRAGKGGGADPPPPVRRKAAALKPRPITAPAIVAPATKLAGNKAEKEKPAGRKAAIPMVNVPPGQPSKASKRRKRAAMRRRLPRSAAIELTVVPGGVGTAPSVADILRRARAEVQCAFRN